MSTDLARAIRDRVDAVAVPPGDLAQVRADGGRIRRRRTTTAVVASAAAVAAVAALAFQVGGADPRSGDGIAPAGVPGTEHGLRYYGEPSEFSMAGRDWTNPLFADVGDLGEPTQHGLVFYSRGVPQLMAPDGEVTALVPDADEYQDDDEVWPSARVDGTQPWVAVTARIDGERNATVRDLATGAEIATIPVAEDSRIVALDDGVVFLSTADGTATWDVRTGERARLAGPATTVSDVRAGVLVHEGPAPDGPAADGYRLLRRGGSAELTLDGAYVTTDGGELESTSGGAAFELLLPADLPTDTVRMTIDTDGSVLTSVLVYEDGVAGQLFDCGYPSGPCELLETWADDGEESQ